MKKPKEERRTTMMKRTFLFTMFLLCAGLLFAGAAAAQQYPMLDDVANKVVQKYQQATCEQLWMEKSQQKPKSAMEQRVIQLLKEDAGMRQEFFRRVSAPIVTKMFECGMIP
jgi:hypothetical protein